MSAMPSVKKNIADAPARVREFAFTSGDFRRVSTLIHQRAGITLNASKEDMAYSRLARRLRALSMNSVKTYLDALEQDPHSDEWVRFTNALTTNLTAFFREPHHFERLQTLLHEHQGSSLLWCAAASTGEEPYSMAIAACEAFGTLTPPVRILATDIDTDVLATAARGIYPLERLENVEPEIRRRYFQRGQGAQAGYCRVRPALQALVQFRPLNLLDPRYPMRGPFKAVFCRNVMIYFDKPTQYAVLAKIMPLMADDGLFFAGHSESFFHAADLVRSCGRTVYAKVAHHATA